MKILFALLMFAVPISADPQRGHRMAAFCSVDGKGGVKCSYSGQACIMIHPDICGTEDPMPNCCNSSPDSEDRNAKECHCCGKKR